MLSIILLPLVCVVTALTAVEPPPTSAETDRASEFHGTCAGTPFWARWLPPDPAFDHHRVLQLVYTPPAPASIDGTHLSDCPFILLDEQTRIIAWNGRTSLSSVSRTARGYHVSRDIETGPDHDRQLRADEHTVVHPLAWDIHLIPLHLALIWRADSRGTATAIELFAAKPGAPVRINWTPGHLTIGTAAWQPTADARGYLQDLRDSDGHLRLHLDARKP